MIEPCQEVDYLFLSKFLKYVQVSIVDSSKVLVTFHRLVFFSEIEVTTH